MTIFTSYATLSLYHGDAIEYRVHHRSQAYEMAIHGYQVVVSL